MSVETTLPIGWIMSNIGNSTFNANGLRKPISSVLRADLKGIYPYYGATGKIDSLNDFAHEGEHVLIGEDGANLLSKAKNLAFIVSGKCWVNNHAHALKALCETPNKYIAYYINSLDLSPYVTGTAQPKLTKANLESIIFPIAPLAEQHQIAQRLDELLAQVDTIKARLDTIPAILKRFRQSVLSAAVSGKLTEEWRGNSELIDWKEHSLSQLINKPSYGSSAKSDKEGKIPVLRMGNIQNGKIDWSDLVYSSNDDEIKKYALEKNDVLFNRTNSPELVGKTAIYKGEQKAIYAGYLIKLRCSAHLNPDFLNFTLNSPKAKDYCMSVKTDGVSQSNINAQKIGSYIINCPPTEEQTEIVRRVDQFFAFTDPIEQRVEDAKARIDKLTQSILAKAFRGELTADWRAEHPELISGENSAETLLAKIQAAKATLDGKKKRTKAS